jgi:sugar phosphate isomerase/epimerase
MTMTTTMMATTTTTTTDPSAGLARELVFCSATLIEAPIEAKVEAAAAGGFQRITLWAHEYDAARAAGWSDAALLRLFTANGIRVDGIDCLLSWIDGETAPDEPMFRLTESQLHRAADALGARWINVAQAFGDSVDLPVVAEHFADICTRAQRYGLLVTLEPIAWAGIRDVDTAAAVLRAAACANARIAIDSWHFFRGGSRIEDLAQLPAGLIDNIQLNDASRLSTGDLWAETADRRLPGEGELPLAALVATLRGMGVRGPWGIEACSPALSALPVAEAGRRCGESMRKVCG